MKKLLPITLGLAATVSMIGCMQTNPVAGSLDASSIPSARFVINFQRPAFATKTAGDHHIEVRVMYTSAYVRSKGFGVDYHIGLAANGSTGYKFNYGTVAPDKATSSLYYKTPSVQDDPIFAAIGYPASSESINPATDSAAYFQDAGIIETGIPNGNASPSFDLYSAGFTPAASISATYAKADDVLKSKVLINAAELMFNNLFSKATYTDSLGAVKTTWGALSGTITPTTAAKGVVTRTLGKGGSTTTTSTLFYKFILPANASKLDLGYMPLGRVVIDYRSYEGDGNTVSKYGYGQYLLQPDANTLNVNLMNGTAPASGSLSL